MPIHSTNVYIRVHIQPTIKIANKKYIQCRTCFANKFPLCVCVRACLHACVYIWAGYEKTNTGMHVEPRQTERYL